MLTKKLLLFILSLLNIRILFIDRSSPVTSLLRMQGYMLTLANFLKLEVSEYIYKHNILRWLKGPWRTGRSLALVIYARIVCDITRLVSAILSLIGRRRATSKEEQTSRERTIATRYNHYYEYMNSCTHLKTEFVKGNSKQCS